MTYDPREPNVDVTDMTDDEMVEAMSHWTSEMQEAALREGWDLWDSRGSISGPLQVQRIDDAELVTEEVGFEVPYLESDDHAMLIVRTGTGEHHAMARHLVAKHNPEDFRRMTYIAENFGKV